MIDAPIPLSIGPEGVGLELGLPVGDGVWVLVVVGIGEVISDGIPESGIGALQPATRMSKMMATTLAFLVKHCSFRSSNKPLNVRFALVNLTVTTAIHRYPIWRTAVRITRID